MHMSVVKMFRKPTCLWIPHTNKRLLWIPKTPNALNPKCTCLQWTCSEKSTFLWIPAWKNVHGLTKILDLAYCTHPPINIAWIAHQTNYNSWGYHRFQMHMPIVNLFGKAHNLYNELHVTMQSLIVGIEPLARYPHPRHHASLRRPCK